MEHHLTLLFLPTLALAGPYPGVAGTTGSGAISKSDPAIVAWAAGHSEIIYGSDVDATWRTPIKATGPAADDVYDIVCLGNGGRITIYFPHPIAAGPGPDFAVFENSFSHTFLELAFVEVSSDGVHFHRFANDSLTASPVGAFGSVDPTNISGFAGKYMQGHGTPFDLADLPADPTLDKQRIIFVRLIDIIGDGNTKDSSGDPIYDPTPTIGSGGFDLDAIAVLHQDDGPFAITRHGFNAGNYRLEWQSNPASSYRVETCTDLEDWKPAATVPASATTGLTDWTTAASNDPKRFWRVIRLAP
ncbi:PEP-CTERM sorting domain-containing protein [Haloferula sargassicola]|uniref:Uncharacterized protein n=1 Tax=Haloferula sargassicola TaxID=490096 RepID=A0ABP9UKD5_9BACT